MKYFFFQNLNIRSEITESELKIPKPDSKYRNIRTGFTPLYRNTRKSEILDLNPNGYPNAHPYLQGSLLWSFRNFFESKENRKTSRKVVSKRHILSQLQNWPKCWPEDFRVSLLVGEDLHWCLLTDRSRKKKIWFHSFN